VVVPHTELLPQPFQPASGWFSLSFRLQGGLDLLSLSSGVGRLIVNHRDCRSFPRLGRVRAPSLRRHYPASAVLRTHPPSASAGAGPHGFAVDAEVPPPHHDRRLPLLRTAHVPCVLPSLPRWDRRLRISLASPATAAFPGIMAGRLPHWRFRGLLDVHSRCGPHGPLTPYGAFSRSASGGVDGPQRHRCARVRVVRTSKGSRPP